MSGALCEKCCVLRSGGGWYAIPATAVREVAEAPPIRPVPGVDSMLSGTCHLRSEFLAVVRLEGLRNGAAPAPGARGQLVVLRGTQGAWALQVEQVVALSDLEASMSLDAERLEAGWGEGFADATLGTATWRGAGAGDGAPRFVRLLDPDGLFRLAQDRLQRGWDSEGASTLASRDSRGGR